jgi:hypothetical protein
VFLSVPRFRVGDRVQLVGDIARFYACIIGVVIQDGTYPASVLNQYKVQLADGTVGVFFDFQLQTPPALHAHVIFDSTVSKKNTGTRGATSGRHVQMASRDVELHFKITDGAKRSIFGQVTAGAVPLRTALVTLLVNAQTVDSKATDDAGEFELSNVPEGEVTIEVLAPGRRVLATLTI